MCNPVFLTPDTPAIQHLCKQDKRLAKVISMVGNITYSPYADAYSFLVHEIIEQMLSVKAAAKIYGRLENLCNGTVTVTAIGNLSDEDIKSIGTANSKVKSIRCLTDAVASGSLNLEELANMNDFDAIKSLTALHGIGTWTAKMYLIFVLDRPNVLPYEDVAFLQSYEWLYKTQDRSKETIKKKCKKWSPYSSIAARYLYRALDLGLTKNEFHLYKQEVNYEFN